MIDQRLTDFAEAVMRATEAVCGVTRAELILRLKKQPTRLIIPRYIGWKILYTNTVHFRRINGNRVMTLARIGELYGGFGHVTVIYGIKQCMAFIGEDSVPPIALWKVPYDSAMEKLQPAIKAITVDSQGFFSHDRDGYRGASRFLYDIGEFGAYRGTRSEVIDTANSLIQKYKA